MAHFSGFNLPALPSSNPGPSKGLSTSRPRPLDYKFLKQIAGVAGLVGTRKQNRGKVR